MVVAPPVGKVFFLFGEPVAAALPVRA